MAAQVPSRSPSVATAQGRSKDSTPRLRRPCPRSCHRHPAVAHGGTDGARSDGAGGDQMDGVLAGTAGEVADANSVSLDDERVSRGPGPIQRVRELLMREREFFRGGGGAMPLDNGSGGSWFGGGGSGDAGRRFLGGGGGGREDNDSEDEWRARLPGERRLLLGGWVPPVLLYYNKLLVSWFLDPEDYHTLAILADFGFLTFLGAMSLVTLISRTYAVAPFIIECGMVHMAMEIFFDGFVGRHGAEGRNLMTPDIFMHHFAAIVGFMACVAADSPRLYLGCTKLVLTEVTVALPVAFHQGRKRKNVHGARAAVIGVLMPLAFAARTVWVFDTVAREFYRRPELLLKSPVLMAGSVAGTTLWVLNALWTAKCTQGAFKVFSKTVDGRTRTAAPARQPVSDNSSRAPVAPATAEGLAQAPSETKVRDTIAQAGKMLLGMRGPDLGRAGP